MTKARGIDLSPRLALTECAKAIRAWRSRFMHTQREAAAFLSITPAYLCDIEHARRQITDDGIARCPNSELRAALIDARCRELQMRIDWLRLNRADVVGQP